MLEAAAAAEAEAAAAAIDGSSRLEVRLRAIPWE